MFGYFDFWNYCDEVVGCIGDDVLDFFFCIEVVVMCVVVDVWIEVFFDW